MPGNVDNPTSSQVGYAPGSLEPAIDGPHDFPSRSFPTWATASRIALIKPSKSKSVKSALIQTGCETLDFVPNMGVPSFRFMARES